MKRKKVQSAFGMPRDEQSQSSETRQGLAVRKDGRVVMVIFDISATLGGSSSSKHKGVKCASLAAQLINQFSYVSLLAEGILILARSLQCIIGDISLYI